MRITRKGRYAVRILVDIALNRGKPVSRRDLSARQQIAPDYLAQILQPLRAAGFVVGVKGPGGGYALARDAMQICIGDVLRATEGAIALSDCTTDDAEATCQFAETCRSRLFWAGLSQVISDYANGWTIADLCQTPPSAAKTKEQDA